MKDVTKLTPYSAQGSKGEQIEAMFDHIAPAYDFMNSAMSLGQHRRWRDTALRLAEEAAPSPGDILDVATGTGDVAFALRRRFPDARITGLDLSEGMLNVARNLQASNSYFQPVEFIKGDCLRLPFDPNSFDLLTVAYGVRNFQNLPRGLAEMHRVLRPGGTACIIELSRPTNPLALAGYTLYTRLIPLAGKLIAGDSDAYRYLPQSIAACPQRDAMCALIKEAGFESAQCTQLTLGTLCIYIAKK